MDKPRLMAGVLEPCRSVASKGALWFSWPGGAPRPRQPTFRPRLQPGDRCFHFTSAKGAALPAAAPLVAVSPNTPATRNAGTRGPGVVLPFFVWQQSYPPNSVGNSVIAVTVVSTRSPNSSGTSAALR